MMNTYATTPPIMAAVLEVEEVVAVSGTHSPSLRDEMATEHSVSTVISTPVTMIVVPPLIQLSSREMREPLSVSELPLSQAWNVTCVRDSWKQAKNCSSMMPLLMPHSARGSQFIVMSSNFSFLSTLFCRIIFIIRVKKIMKEESCRK